MSKTRERTMLKIISACHKDNKVNSTSKLDVSLNIAENCILGWAKEEKKSVGKYWVSPRLVV